MSLTLSCNLCHSLLDYEAGDGEYLVKPCSCTQKDLQYVEKALLDCHTVILQLEPVNWATPCQKEMDQALAAIKIVRQLLGEK